MQAVSCNFNTSKNARVESRPPKWGSAQHFFYWPDLGPNKHRLVTYIQVNVNIGNTVIIFHFEGMSFSSAHDLKQWDFLDNNEIFSEFAQFIRQHILTILTIKQLVSSRGAGFVWSFELFSDSSELPRNTSIIERWSFDRQSFFFGGIADDYLTDYSNRNHAKKIEMLTCFVIVLNTIISRAGRHRSNVQQNAWRMRFC